MTASRWLQIRRSEDRQLVRAAVELRELGERRDLKVFGGLVIHDGDCPIPEGDCNCEGGPLRLVPRRSR